LPEIETRLNWGHALLVHDCADTECSKCTRSIRVPASVFPKLRRLGLLTGNRAELSPLIHTYLSKDFDALTDGLRHVLGSDLSGPSWLVCRCRACKTRTEDPIELDEREAKYVDIVIAETKQKFRLRVAAA
jgi:hypothetical protein